jgi:hypothetical protein
LDKFPSIDLGFSEPSTNGNSSTSYRLEGFHEILARQLPDSTRESSSNSAANISEDESSGSRLLDDLVHVSSLTGLQKSKDLFFLGSEFSSSPNRDAVPEACDSRGSAEVSASPTCAGEFFANVFPGDDRLGAPLDQRF